jgi:predicted RNA binding protein YcfA (HicA-like mRNA interferase family)
MKKASDVFKSIRFAKAEPRGKPHSSTDEEGHYTVGEKEFNQQLKHVKKMAMQEEKKDVYDEGEYDREGDMAKSDLRSIIANAQRLHDMIDDADNLPEWVQSKITVAEDYISTVANYMTAEVNEEYVAESGGEVLMKKGEYHIEKYGEDAFALYKNGKKQKYYTSMNAAKSAMNEELELTEADAKDYHSVHVNGRHWKTFDTKSHAENVAKKVKGATVHKYDAERLQRNYGAQSAARNAARGKQYDESVEVEQLDEMPGANMDTRAVHQHLKKKHGMKEEVEQIDELSKKTLGSYVNKAMDSARELPGAGTNAEASKKTKRYAAVSAAAYRTQGLAPRKGTDMFRKYKAESVVAEGEKQSNPREMDLDWHYKNIINTKGLSDKAKKDTTDIYNKLKKEKNKQGVAEEVEYIEEKNAPTNPDLWSRAKALAKSKFDVYPSAYANGWAAKWYKSKGGGWKTVSEEVEQLEEMPGANMDTRAVHAHLKKKGWKLSRTSGGHDVYTHTDVEHHIAVPRHRQLKAPLVKGILKQSNVNEDIDSQIIDDAIAFLKEGRPSQRHPLEGHDYHKKTDAELRYIAKDAHEAAEAMKSHNTQAENKYRDQANDSATVRYWRQKHGMPDWYKKKYGHLKEEKEMPPFDPPYKKSGDVVTDKSGAKHTALSRVKHLAKQAMKKQTERMKKPRLEEEKDDELSSKTKIVRDVAKKGKKKNDEEMTAGGKDKFESNPELTSQIVKT